MAEASKKVLVVRKPDRTVHVVPLGNKAYLQSQNRRLPADKRLKFEEMEEAEALKLPFFDESYVSAVAAQDKLKEVEGNIAEKDSKIAELEAKLRALEASQGKGAQTTATQVIEEVAKVENIEDAKAFLEGETRKTVIDAVNKKIAELEAK